MKSEIVVAGGGASGLMAAYHAARTLVEAGKDAQVTVLEKMPRPARKVMITEFRQVRLLQPASAGRPGLV